MKRTRVAVAMTSSLVAFSCMAGGPAQAQLADCPEVMPVADVTDGMDGTGYTVSEGTDPDPFDVEVLGVLENGIGAGRDMIIVDTSSPAIDEAGGIWAGMSGSPVYVDGKLLGAVAYGLSFGPSSIGGVTPAEDMLDIADRPTAEPAKAMPRRVQLDRSSKRAIARSTATRARQVSNSMKRLLTPLSISGAGQRVMDEIAETIDRENLPLIPYAGSSAAGPSQQQQPAPPPEPGGNFAAAISYGDVTFAGVGTTTYVCGDKILAFGHPFFFLPTGETTVGANNADTIAIIDDPTFSGFKLANVTGSIGTVDQDRFAGIRAIIGDGPTTIPITSLVNTSDGLAEREGSSEVVTSEYVPMVALSHLLSNMDMTWDQIDEGSSEMAWTVTGETESGVPFELSRTNTFSSQYDISYTSLFELDMQLYTLFYNQFEDIEFTGVDATATIDDAVKQYSIAQVLVSTDGETFEKKRRVRVDRGGTVFLQVELEPYEGTENEIVEFEVELPNSVRRQGYIEIIGGQDSFYYSENYFCFVEGSGCGGQANSEIDSFEDLVASFQEAPQNHELIVRLRGARGQELSEQVVAMDQVVTGARNVNVNISSGCCGGEGGGVSEPKPPGKKPVH